LILPIPREIIEHTEKEIRGAIIDEQIWRSQLINPAEAGFSFTRYSEDTHRLEIYPSSGGDYWRCLKCKARGNKWYMLDHVYNSRDSIVIIFICTHPIKQVFIPVESNNVVIGIICYYKPLSV
jgi:hypothetical protein